MNPEKTLRQRWLPAGALGALLLVSHGAAAVVAIELARSGRVAAALVAALATGMVLTLTLQRTIWLAHAALSDLNAGRLPTEIPARGRWPLASLVAQANTVIARQREVRDLRQNLLRQAGESAAQQERNRLARELHDSIKQQIFGISMGAAAAQARWESDPQAAQRALGDVRRSAQETMVEMNALLQQLSPAPLERVGLSQALRDQGEAFSYRTGADAQVTFGELPADDRLPAGAQESLFRIAQEALSNAARHARAGQVRLSLGLRDPDGPLVLEIQDDGQGFEPEVAQGGMGLANIHQRVLALGGEVAIDSSPGRGTLVRASIPLVEPQISDALRAVAVRADTYRQDHTLNKTFLVGIGGGLALIVLLF
jgi:signal transduction histidine kinase